jgi:glycerol-3-phosphate dehydrogenase
VSDLFDLLIIGGGVNGTGIARDAAGRGLSVALVEQGDLAQATSSASSKLIHGGLRYLEQYEFRLVREALAEREVLLAAAPHIIWPLRFVLPHDHTLRPWWLVRTGLFLYDHIGGRRSLPGTADLRFPGHPAGNSLKPEIRRGFEYSDCWVEDARLVVLNARGAAERGAQIWPRTRCVRLERQPERWVATLEDTATGAQREVSGRVLINAAGPWVVDLLTRVAGRNTTRGLRLIKGSHIVVKRLYTEPHCFILQNHDRRIVFVIPYEHDYTLIGTTDVPVEGDPTGIRITSDETEYLCAAVSRWFAKPVTPADVVWSYAGVRPLYDDHAASASTVTRDYVLDFDADGGAPVLSVFGGKITTFRRLAEHAMERIAKVFPGCGGPWTAGVPLPGGQIGQPSEWLAGFQRRHPWIEPANARRLMRAYGTDADVVIGDAKSMADLGEAFGAGLTAREVDYLHASEWAASADDILWRRSKLGLHVPPGAGEAIAAYLAR